MLRDFVLDQYVDLKSICNLVHPFNKKFRKKETHFDKQVEWNRFVLCGTGRCSNGGTFGCAWVRTLKCSECVKVGVDLVSQRSNKCGGHTSVSNVRHSWNRTRTFLGKTFKNMLIRQKSFLVNSRNCGWGTHSPRNYSQTNCEKWTCSFGNEMGNSIFF